MRQFRLIALCIAFAAFSPSGCALKEAVEDAQDAVDDLDNMSDEEAKMKILATLFPDLTEEELEQLAVDLTLDEAIDLEAELEAAREEAEELSKELLMTAEGRVAEREDDLSSENGGFPEEVAAIGLAGFYDEASGACRIDISGVLRGSNAVLVTDDQVSVSIAGAAQETTTRCLYDGTPVDIVFLIDITGSMAQVILSVRESVVRFVDLIVSSGLQGTIGVVTFQDTVGVNVTFQEPAPPYDGERSPFFEPVPMDDSAGIEALKSFVSRLEANRGDDWAENLVGAVDFARNNVIGYANGSTPNVIGEGGDDPPDTEPWPRLTGERQVFVAMTDAPFHSDSRDEMNSSLHPEFIPRDLDDVISSLNLSGTIVNVSDPSWVDETLSPNGDDAQVDADYFAVHTGGVGEDVVLGYSLVDLELAIIANDTGLLDITLDRLLETTCAVEFTADLSAGAAFDLTIEDSGEIFSQSITPAWL